MTVLDAVLDTVPEIVSVSLKGIKDLELVWNLEYDDGSLLNIEDKYYVKSITGLEPPERTVSISRGAAGGKFGGIVTEDREIVVLIGLNPDYDAGETVSLLRQNLYTLLSTGYDPKVNFVFMSVLGPAFHEYGYVGKFEAAIFDQEPVVQITFEMLNPTFRALAQTTYNPAHLSETAPDVYNSGTAETGFQFAVKFTDTKNGWFIRQAENRQIGMNFDMTFEAGDILTVSTIPGQMYVHWQKHRGKVKNKLGILTADSEWLMLHPGHNHFVVPAKVAKWDWHGKLAFTPHYWGI